MAKNEKVKNKKAAEGKGAGGTAKEDDVVTDINRSSDMGRKGDSPATLENGGTEQ